MKTTFTILPYLPWSYLPEFKPFAEPPGKGYGPPLEEVMRRKQTKPKKIRKKKGKK